MKVKQISVASVEDAPNINPNHMDHDEYVILLEQIKRFGFSLQPPVLRDHGDGRLVIIDGHHRMRACREVGLTQTYAVVLALGEHLDDRILQISMNKLRGRLDLAQVGHLADALQQDGVPLDDVLLSGFTQPDLVELIEALAGDDNNMPDLNDVRNLDSEFGEKAPKPFVLEVTFSSRDNYKACRKALKRASSTGELADGLLAVLALDDDAETA